MRCCDNVIFIWELYCFFFGLVQKGKKAKKGKSCNDDEDDVFVDDDDEKRKKTKKRKKKGRKKKAENFFWTMPATEQRLNRQSYLSTCNNRFEKKKGKLKTASLFSAIFFFHAHLQILQYYQPLFSLTIFFLFFFYYANIFYPVLMYSHFFPFSIFIGVGNCVKKFQVWYSQKKKKTLNFCWTLENQEKFSKITRQKLLLEDYWWVTEKKRLLKRMLITEFLNRNFDPVKPESLQILRHLQRSVLTNFQKQSTNCCN